MLIGWTRSVYVSDAQYERVDAFEEGFDVFMEGFDAFEEGFEGFGDFVHSVEKGSVHMATAKKTSGGKTPQAARSKSNKAAKPALLSSTQLAELLGIKLTKRLDTAAVRKLRKALPGYVNLLDDVASLLEADAELLNLRDVRPRDLLDVQARQKYLSAREGVVEAVYRSVYEQRLQADDAAMGMLLKVARRVDSAAEDDPDVLVRWKSVLDFLSKFRRGASTAAPVVTEQDEK